MAAGVGELLDDAAGLFFEWMPGKVSGASTLLGVQLVPGEPVVQRPLVLAQQPTLAGDAEGDTPVQQHEVRPVEGVVTYFSRRIAEAPTLAGAPIQLS